jgi:exopolysaccharide biosynthesis polyprenyl glycosylphosphotransferase
MVAIRVAADVIAVALAIAAATALRFGAGVLKMTDAPEDVSGHALAVGLWVASVLGVMASQRLYDEDTLSDRRSENRRIRVAVFEGVAIVASAVFLFHLFTVSRGWFLLLVAGSYVGLVAERAVARAMLERARRAGRMRRPVVLVGGFATDVVGDEFTVVAHLDITELAAYISSAVERRRRWGVASPGVLLQADTRPSDELWDLVVRAGGAGVPAYVASRVRSVAADRLTARELGGRTIVKVAPPALAGIRAFDKRAMDVIGSILLLAVTAIPMLAIAVAILVTSGRPILYGQERVGRDGRVFRMWKFRSMRIDAEEESGAVWATRDDPRRTRLGAFLRTSSLDELPQLCNVVRGDMSIVGPRPERPTFVDGFANDLSTYAHRHRIRPGMTGLAQVRGLRGDTELAPRVDADNWYIEHWSIGLDLAIGFRTIVEVLRHRNAG